MVLNTITGVILRKTHIYARFSLSNLAGKMEEAPFQAPRPNARTAFALINCVKGQLTHKNIKSHWACLLNWECKLFILGYLAHASCRAKVTLRTDMDYPIT